MGLANFMSYLLFKFVGVIQLKSNGTLLAGYQNSLFVSYTYVNESVGQPWGFVKKIYREEYDRQTMQQLRSHLII